MPFLTLGGSDELHPLDLNCIFHLRSTLKATLSSCLRLPYRLEAKLSRIELQRDGPLLQTYLVQLQPMEGGKVYSQELFTQLQVQEPLKLF